MRPRLTGFVGGLATACALALAACGGDERTVETVTDESGSARLDQTVSCLEDEGFTADAGHVTASAREDGTTGAISVLLNLEAGSAADNVVDIYFWNSRENATAYVRDAGGGPLDALHREQLGTATITYAHGHSHGHEDSHDGEAEEIDHEVETIATCVA